MFSLNKLSVETLPNYFIVKHGDDPFEAKIQIDLTDVHNGYACISIGQSFVRGLYRHLVFKACSIAYHEYGLKGIMSTARSEYAERFWVKMKNDYFYIQQIEESYFMSYFNG